MGFFSGLIHPLEYLIESSDATFKEGDKKRAEEWSAILFAVSFFLIFLNAIYTAGFNDILSGVGGGLLSGLFSAAVSVGILIILSKLASFSINTAGGETTWGNVFCTMIVCYTMAFATSFVFSVVAYFLGDYPIAVLFLYSISFIVSVVYLICGVSATGDIGILKSSIMVLIPVVVFLAFLAYYTSLKIKKLEEFGFLTSLIY